jgi:uncharacterized membrane protein YeaQ/YmgE (transglycosylase-associated protein family)
MHFIWIALIGLVIGALAKFLTPGRGPGGCVVTMIVGLVGSVVGGALARELKISTTGSVGWFIMSIIGAVILLLLYRMIIGRKNAP